MNIRIGECTIEVVRGDITKLAVDAIVNAANSALAGGGGVDGAIHHAAGPSLMEELRRYDGCPTGGVVLTGAGALPAKYVFHAVGPVYRGGHYGEAEQLASCYATAVRLANEYGCGSMSFPSISTGIYRYPLKEAATVALRALTKVLQSGSGTLRAIKLVQFSDDGVEVYGELISDLEARQAAAQTG